MNGLLTDPRSITLAIRKVRQDGDHAAFKELVGAYHGEVVAFAQQFLGSERQSNLMDRDDVAQSVFIKLWQGLAGGNTWIMDAATDRDTLINVLERMTWLRARRAVRHSLALKRSRAKTTREGDVTLPSGDALAQTFPEKNPDFAPALTAMNHLMIEDAERWLLRAAKSDKQGALLIDIFQEMLRKTPQADTAKRLDVTTRSVQRLCGEIRRILESWLDDEVEHLDNEPDGLEVSTIPPSPDPEQRQP